MNTSIRSANATIIYINMSRSICISFKRISNLAVDQFKKVFVKVQFLSVSGCHLGEQLPTFVKCFPNVHSFVAADCYITERFHGQPFQHFEYLALRNLFCSDEFTVNQAVADLLNGVHQLKSLDIGMITDEDDINALLDLIRLNPCITKLVSMHSCDVPVTSADVQRIVAEHSALIELNLFHEFVVSDVIALIRQLDSLKTFSFRISDSKYTDLVSQLDKEWKVNRYFFVFQESWIATVKLQR